MDVPYTVNIEYEFLLNYQILSLEDFDKLNESRASINEKLTNRVISHKELLNQIIVELNLFQLCKNKITSLEKHLDVIESETIYILANRIIILFDHMHVLFAADNEVISNFIEFFDDNVKLYNINQFQILVDTVRRLKDNRNIWIQLLKLHFKLDGYQKLLYVFKKGVRSLKADSLPLWMMMIENFRDKRPDMVEELFEEGSCLSYSNISLEIRPKYLEWCIEYKKLDDTRNLFNKLKELKPASIKLYLSMISIECKQTNFEADTVRTLFNELCVLFGDNNVDVWIDYIRFEYTHGSEKLMRRICSKAIWSLKSHLKDIIVDEFNKLENEFKKNLGTDIIVIDDD